MKKSHLATLLIFLIAIPATLVLGLQLPGRWYFLTSTLVIAEILIPFFLAFEGRKPQARELVIMAVLCALAVAARVAIVIPNFKAIYGVIMIAGIALGPEPDSWWALLRHLSAISSGARASGLPGRCWPMAAAA